MFPKKPNVFGAKFLVAVCILYGIVVLWDRVDCREVTVAKDFPRELASLLPGLLVFYVPISLD